jgi:hypothetical protein
MAPKVTNLFVSSALLLALSVTSFARIGETMDEAVKRYGDVVHHGITHGEELYSFKKIILIFWRIFMREKSTVSCIAVSRVAN